MTTQNEKREQKKQEIIEEMMKFKDEYGNIDLTRLRKENDKLYNRISYYFKGMDNALMAAGATGKGGSNSSEPATGAPVNRKTLRNELAYDMLVQLREKHTLEDIAQRYGCSRAHVNQLFQSLSKTVGATEDQEDKFAE